MNDYELEALHHARAFAAEAEGILNVAGVEAELEEMTCKNASFGTVANRNFSVVDAATIASMLINLFMWIGQIRRRQVHKNASKEEIIQDLMDRVLVTDDLANEVKERLIRKALEHL
jgi:hypothetical protein